jgi:hypothetical protein
LAQSEFLEFLLGRQVHLPIPANQQFFAPIGTFAHTAEKLNTFREWFFSHESYTLRFSVTSQKGTASNWTFSSYPSFDFSDPRQFGMACHVKLDGTTTVISGPLSLNTQMEVGQAVADQVSRLIYRFTAERFSLGVCTAGANRTLQPRAANLPEVLDILQANNVAFYHFNKTVKEILPQLGFITVLPYGSQQRKILVWSEVAYRSAREDLAIDLDECGTGIGQVLALIYVVHTSYSPQIIVIDEPQSFLHPGAARKLIEVLKQYPQHQYIIATHSPTIITAAQPQTIILVTNDGTESHLETLDAKEAEQLRKYFDEIGASFADVYGADQILWVEGITEEKCYPRIVEQILKRPLMGTVIKAVIATGDFEGRHAERFFEVYNKLSGAQNLIPRPVAWLFDHEARTEAQKRELNSLGNGKVRFTRCRMFENNLLGVRAIAAVLNTTDERTQTVSEAQVQGSLEEAVKDPKYFEPLQPDRGVMWIRADVVLKRVFREVADLDFRKTVHSIELTSWLIENDPVKLGDVADDIRLALGWE